MIKEEYVTDAETLIGACSTALWLAEIAKQVKDAAEYLDSEDLYESYRLLKKQVVKYSGVNEVDHNDEVLDAAIERFWK